LDTLMHSKDQYTLDTHHLALSVRGDCDNLKLRVKTIFTE